MSATGTAPGADEEVPMKVDCAQCDMYRSEHCDDCLVTALLHPPADVVEIEEGLDDQLTALSGAGLIPVLKFRPRSSASPPQEVSDTG